MGSEAMRATVDMEAVRRLAVTPEAVREFAALIQRHLDEQARAHEVELMAWVAAKNAELIESEAEVTVLRAQVDGLMRANTHKMRTTQPDRARTRLGIAARLMAADLIAGGAMEAADRPWSRWNEAEAIKEAEALIEANERFDAERAEREGAKS